MTFAVPKDAQYLRVELAKKAGGTVTRSVVVLGGDSLDRVSTAAFRACTRSRITVTHIIRITHKGAVLFDASTQERGDGSP